MSNTEDLMPICKKCKNKFPEEEMKFLQNYTLCEDCYIDEVMPKMTKAHYNNDAEFMNRLKETYTIRRQKYH